VLNELSGGTGGRKGGRLPAVLRNRNFARLFSAGVGSAAGFAIGQIALTLIVYGNTNSALDVAFIGISFIVATVLFSLIAGVLVDRYERRKLMVLSDLARAAALVVLIFSLLLIGFSLPIILAAAFILGTFTTLFQPAERALTPVVVGSDQLATANALVQSTNSVIQFASNSAGGLIYEFLGVTVALSLNAGTFLLSALLIVGISGVAVSARPTAAAGKKPSIWQDAREGLGYIRRNRGLLELTVSSGAANFFLVMVLQFFVIYTETTLKGGGTLFGVLNGLFLLGVAPGAYASSRYKTVRHAGKVFILSGVGMGLCSLGLVAIPSLVTSSVLIFALGLLLGLLNTTWLTTVQLIVPTEMQGRYFGVDQLGSTAVIPLGQLLGGVVITASGIGTDYLVAGVGTILSMGLFAFSPYLWNLRFSGASSVPPAESSAGGGIRTHESR
jgi:MFS family permease